jgi:alpha-L-arabinofuranosidase
MFMNKSREKSSKARFVVFGVVLGLALAGAAAFLAYQFMAGDLKSKVRYALIKGREHMVSLTKEKMAKAPAKAVIDQRKIKDAVLSLTIQADREIGAINPMIYGSQLNSKMEFEMDVAKFGKAIGVTNFRFPGGGSFGYHWHEGSYDFVERFNAAPLSKIENVIKFKETVGAEDLVIQINLESGTSQEAAEWVEYMNKEQGKYVRYWELGNEVYGDWDRAYMTGEKYAGIIKEYAVRMREVDPNIKIGANWGGPKYQEFDQAVMEGAADHIDFVSYHWYPNHVNQYKKYKGRSHPPAEDIMANSLAVADFMGRFHGMVEKYAPHRKGKIEFTVMEWDGSWDGVSSDLRHEYKGMMWSLANAIFYADALGQFARHGITVANQYTFQEVMFGLIRGWDREAGWGGDRWDGETIRPKALAFQLFANHFNGNLIEHTLIGAPTYFKEADWRADSYTGDVPYVSSHVSKAAAGDSITIALINKHADYDFKIKIAIDGAAVANAAGEAWILNGPELESQNDGMPGTIDVKKYELGGVQNKFNYHAPAHSVSILRIPLKK